MDSFSYSFSESVPVDFLGAVSDRRRSTRHATVLQIARLRSFTEDELCIVRDVSAGGLRAEIYVDLEVGEAVLIELKSGIRLDGKIAWVDGHMAGVAFNTRTSLTALLACSTQRHDGRMARRPRVRAEGTARLLFDSYDIEVRLRDASQGGMKIDVDRRLECERDCAIDAAGAGILHGRVKWCRHGQAGIMLLQPMCYQDFVRWRRAQRVSQEQTPVQI